MKPTDNKERPIGHNSIGKQLTDEHPIVIQPKADNPIIKAPAIEKPHSESDITSPDENADKTGTDTGADKTKT